MSREYACEVSDCSNGTFGFYCDHHLDSMQRGHNITICEKCGIVKRISDNEKTYKIELEECNDTECKSYEKMFGKNKWSDPFKKTNKLIKGVLNAKK